ncbi:MAG: CHASE2 domain-containing protein [Cyanobacteria bacterium P01_D01_bin.14]
MANKLVILKVFGSLTQGVQIALEIGQEGEPPSTEIMGTLPADPDLLANLQQWQHSYRSLSGPQRIRPKEIVHGGSIQPVADCQRLAQRLQGQFQTWLSQASFRPLDQQLREDLSREDTVRVLIRTEDVTLQQLPWHSWSVIDRYPKAEISLGAVRFSAGVASPTGRQSDTDRSSVKILAILGHSDGIDVAVDRRLLEGLPQAAVTFLVEPERDAFNAQLWNQPWDILFFAGHSLSQSVEADGSGLQGRLFINPDDSLTISELKYGFRQAVANGLKLAIFNSCDGLGLAEELKPLGLPHLILMREPVPDLVAQSFLRNFLTAYAAGAPLHLAERQARERLQGLENTFPCASWLPVLVHASQASPPDWAQLSEVDSAAPDLTQASTEALASSSKARRFPWPSRVQVGLAVAAVVSTVRWMGGLQPLELRVYDWLLAQRPATDMPSRVLVIEATEADVETYGYPLPDDVLVAAIDQLEEKNPRLVGLDIFRSQPNDALQAKLEGSNSLVALCSPGQPSSSNQPGVPPPPNLPEDRVGFSTVVEDPDGVLRRQLLFSQPDTNAPCSTRFSLSTLLALRYLDSEGIGPENLDRQRLRLGQAIFSPLESHAGPYHAAESRGFQIFLNYTRQLGLCI